MKPVMQKVVSAGEGDCMSACLASILELPLDRVPNFYVGKGDWFNQLWKFLERAHLEWGGQRVPVIALSKSNGIDGYFMAVVQSINFPEKTHAVVFKGKEFVHDPSPLKSKEWTIDDVKYFYILERITY